MSKRQRSSVVVLWGRLPTCLAFSGRLATCPTNLPCCMRQWQRCRIALLLGVQPADPGRVHGMVTLIDQGDVGESGVAELPLAAALVDVAVHRQPRLDPFDCLQEGW